MPQISQAEFVELLTKSLVQSVQSAVYATTDEINRLNPSVSSEQLDAAESAGIQAATEFIQEAVRLLEAFENGDEPSPTTPILGN